MTQPMITLVSSKRSNNKVMFLPLYIINSQILFYLIYLEPEKIPPLGRSFHVQRMPTSPTPVYCSVMNQRPVYFVILNHLEIQNVHELACIRLQIKYFLLLSCLVNRPGQSIKQHPYQCSFLYPNNSEGFEQEKHLIAIN